MRIRLSCSLIAAGLLIFQFLAPAMAQEEAPITVLVMAASNTGEGVDPPYLRRIIGLLGSPYDSYTTYRLIDRSRGRLSRGETLTVQLPEGRELSLTPVNIGNDMVQIRAGIRGVINTQFSIPMGGTQFLGGFSSPQGDIIIAIQVE